MHALSSKRSFANNVLLASLSPSDLAAISPLLEPILLNDRAVLQEPNRRVEHVHFIESGIVSVRVVAARSALETALIGYQGALGITFFRGGHIPTHQSIVLLRGSALRIHVDDLCRFVNDRPDVSEHFSQYSQALNMHCAHMGVCGVRHKLEERLACWICLACDAIGSRTVPVTHDYISTFLGLRRAGVTEALIRFEEQGLVRKTRGILEVDDRGRLERRTCSCYGIISNAYTMASRQTCLG
jgi:CRP-like cAMP-binding protein